MPSVGAPSDLDKFKEAIQWFRGRVPVTAEQFALLDELEREFAFRMAGVNQARVVADVFAELDRAIAEGVSFAEFADQVSESLARAWGAPNAWRVETIFRTNVLSAYAAGRQEIIDNPEVQAAAPLLRFDAAGDNRTTDICTERDGLVLPASDPFWLDNTPPLHFNCRSVLVPVDEDTEPRRKRVITRPMRGFGRKPSGRPPSVDVDLTQFPDEVSNLLQQRLARGKVV